MGKKRKKDGIKPLDKSTSSTAKVAIEDHNEQEIIQEIDALNILYKKIREQLKSIIAKNFYVNQTDEIATVLLDHGKRIMLLSQTIQLYLTAHPTANFIGFIQLQITHWTLLARARLYSRSADEAMLCIRAAAVYLTTHLPLLKFTDETFAEDVSFVLHGELDEFESNSKVMPTVSQHIFQFCSKSVGVKQLSLLLRVMCQPTTEDPLVSTASLERRQLFWCAYKTLRFKLENELARDSSHLENALAYAAINFIAYKFEMFCYFYKNFKIVNNHDQIVIRYFLSAKISTNELYRFSKFDTLKTKNYLQPSLDALAKANADNLVWNFYTQELARDFIRNYGGACYQYSAIYSVMREKDKDLNLYDDLMLQHGVYLHLYMALKVIDIIDHPDLHAFSQKVLKNNDHQGCDCGFCAISMMNEKIAKDRLMHEKEISDFYLVTLKQESAEVESMTKAIAEKADLLMLEWESEANQHKPRYVAKKSKKIKKAMSAKKPAEILDDVDEPDQNRVVETTNQHLITAYQHMKGSRIVPAMEAFKLAFQEARRSGKMQEQLDALDGQLFLSAKILIKILDKNLCIIDKRKMTYDLLTIEEQSHFRETILSSSKDRNAIEALYKLFLELVSTANVKENAANTIRLMSDFIKTINDKITQIKVTYQSLRELIDKKRDLYIRRLGYESAMQDGFYNLSEADYYERGYKIFQAQGEARRAGGEERSHIAQEREFFIKLSKDIESLTLFNHDSPELLKTTAIEKQLYVEFPEEIKRVIKEITSVSSVCILHGSWAIELVSRALKLKRHSLITSHSDVDVLVPRECEAALPKIGLTPSGLIPYLYTRKEPRPDVDCSLINMQAEQWEVTDRNHRDFTITVAFDQHGYLLASSYPALKDIEAGVLRTIHHPVTAIQQDPVILLRAMRYIMASFSPDEDLQKAILSFELCEEQHKPHLFAVAKKHLRMLDSYAYVQLLKEYGLLKKLFNIDCSEVDDVTVWRLKLLVGFNFNYKPKHLGFFEKTPEAVAAQQDIIDPMVASL